MGLLKRIYNGNLEGCRLNELTGLSLPGLCHKNDQILIYIDSHRDNSESKKNTDKLNKQFIEGRKKIQTSYLSSREIENP